MNVTVNAGQTRNLTIKLHPGWFLFLCLVTCLLAARHLPAAYPGFYLPTYWLLGSLISLLVGGLVLAREAGRLLVAVHYRLPLRQIVIFPFGAVMQMGHKPIPLPVELRLVAAGLLSNLTLTGILTALWLLGLGIINLWLALFSLGLVLFNLFPAAPLDGGRLLQALVRHLTRDSVTATRVTFLIDWLVSVGLILSGGIAVLVSFFTDDFVLVLMDGLLLLITGWLLEAAAVIQPPSLSRHQLQQLQGTVVAQMMARNESPSLPLVVPRNGNVSKVLRPSASFMSYLSHNNSNVRSQQSALLNIPSLLSWVVHPQTGLLNALQQMDGAGTSTLLVVKGYRIVAILSREELVEYIKEKTHGI